MFDAKSIGGPIMTGPQESPNFSGQRKTYIYWFLQSLTPIACVVHVHVTQYNAIYMYGCRYKLRIAYVIQITIGRSFLILASGHEHPDARKHEWWDAEYVPCP